MSLTEIEDDPPDELDYWTLVEFSWSVSPTLYKRYTTSTSEQLFLGEKFEPKPDLDVDVAKHTGVLKEQPTKVQMQMDPWLDQVTGPEPFAPLAVRVIEVQKAGAESDYRFRFSGTVRKTFRNANGKRGLVRLECVNVKDLLEAEVSFRADLQCDNTFGEKPCPINLATVDETATVDDLTGVIATLSGLAPVNDPAKGKYWHRGFLEKEGLRITIRDWDQTDPGRFVLVRAAPASWLGTQVRAVPGCDLLPDTCLNRWNALRAYTGIGIRMPDYNPTLEEPPEELV